ncbi:MarR family transcriptional regulator [Rhizobium sp. Leaf384]|uniref:MarR family winged helix-turn-helix transcriptional regulator n=1 Tax=unclassified Rhizobium TaxID=2613769 RepID=UPI00071290BE|nr:MULTISPECIES: MarR family transcriptional regulator [unclassified Rhizobium]KQS77112.1 MarR family transcriptional regulator [Rhizobium sp. Leaf384]KQS78383.1 MarR family transcriptional regulator [Rhizobium sp. Leaf383]
MTKRRADRTETTAQAVSLSIPLPLEDQLCFAVYSLSHAFNRTYKPLLDRFGLTYPQYLVLLALWEHRVMTVKQIGDQLGLDSGTLSPLLKRLDAAGFVSRTRDRKDERQVNIALTEKGEALQAEAGHVQTAIGSAIGCSNDEAHALKAVLDALTERLSQPKDPLIVG